MLIQNLPNLNVCIDNMQINTEASITFLIYIALVTLGCKKKTDQ
jgi:hypothetical protein